MIRESEREAMRKTDADYIGYDIRIRVVDRISDVFARLRDQADEAADRQEARRKTTPPEPSAERTARLAEFPVTHTARRDGDGWKITRR